MHHRIALPGPVFSPMGPTRTGLWQGFMLRSERGAGASHRARLRPTYFPLASLDCLFVSLLGPE